MEASPSRESKRCSTYFFSLAVSFALFRRVGAILEAAILSSARAFVLRVSKFSFILSTVSSVFLARANGDFPLLNTFCLSSSVSAVSMLFSRLR